MTAITIKTARNCFKTIVGERLIPLNKKVKLTDAFVLFEGRYGEFSFKQRHYILPMKDIILLKASVVYAN